jgi:hypothetical protein
MTATKVFLALAASALLLSPACGGSAPVNATNNNVVVTTGQNVQPINVNPGPNND